MTPALFVEVAPSDTLALLLLAVVQGLTEFLPISSSGHLVLAEAAMGFDDPSLAVEVALHVGTLAAVLIGYRRAVGHLLVGLAGGRWREPLLVVVGTIPAALVGVGLGDFIEDSFANPTFAASGLFVTAAMLVVGEIARRRRGAPSAPAGDLGLGMGFGTALCVGAAQALAILPGISRSGSTIAVGLLCGLDPGRAARFSFLLSIPAILGAAVLRLPDLESEGGVRMSALLLGVAVAAVVGWVALKVLLAFLGRGAFAWFAVYCTLVGSGYLLFGRS